MKKQTDSTSFIDKSEFIFGIVDGLWPKAKDFLLEPVNGEPTLEELREDLMKAGIPCLDNILEGLNRSENQWMKFTSQKAFIIAVEQIIGSEHSVREVVFKHYEKVQRYRLFDLIKKVSKQADKRYRWLPEFLKKNVDRSEWIPDTMMDLLKETEKHYDPAKKKYYNRFATWRVYRRLIDRMQTTFLRSTITYKEWCAFQKLRRERLKKETGQDPTAQELAEHKGWSKEKAQNFLDRLEKSSSVNLDKEIIEARSENLYPENPNYSESGKRFWPAEEVILGKEAIERFVKCAEEILDQKKRMLLVRRELDGMTFEKLYENFRDIFGSESVSAFRHCYERKILKPVRAALKKQYGKPYFLNQVESE